MGTASTWIVYQPLIVGLGAVVLATIGNTLLEWYRHRLQDRREARTLRTAFVEEIRSHRRMLASAMSSDQKEETTGSYYVPIDTFFPVYEHMIGRIGILKPEEAAAILKAYSHLILSPKNLAIIGRIQKVEEFASFAVVDVRFRETLISLNDSLLAACDEAIDVLGGNPRAHVGD